MEPAVSAAVVSVALPADTGTAPSVTAPSLNVMVPVATRPVIAVVTVAVKVTA